MQDKVSVIIVNHNGKDYLSDCLHSLLQADTHNAAVEIIMVDNLSRDDSVGFVREKFPEVTIIENTVNNYVHALNTGITQSRSDYVAFLNNDTIVDKEWLNGLMQVMLSDKNTGAVQSKILFSEGTKINSVGVEEVEDFYFRDVGFDEYDRGQFEDIREIEYCSGGSVLFRRKCLEDVGLLDEDLIMFFEDIDYSIRCRAKGWKIFYAPKSLVYHRYHGSASADLCDYLCSRNRLVCLAKHFPRRLAKGIKTSHFFLRGDKNNLYRFMLQSVRKLLEYHDTETALMVLDELKGIAEEVFGTVIAYQFFSQLEVILGLRKVRIGIYDHAFHFAGGGQRYVAKMAEILKDTYEITYIASKEITREKYREWFQIDLSDINLKIIKIPFFERMGRYFIDEGLVVNEESNPFDSISEESMQYDIFINANMLGKVRPLSLRSVFVCHFPDRKKEKFFHVDKYHYLISNSTYTSYWIQKRWGLIPTHLIYPPVDMYSGQASPERKKKIILSVARFEVGGSKKQVELAKAFQELARKNREVRDAWTLILAGGNYPDNDYFELVRKEIRSAECSIELKPNASYEELKRLYADAAIFWHACGLHEKDPHLIEHFGMTTVEAMQNYCVPIVIDGGGQREIVENTVSGFRFNTIQELIFYTQVVIHDEALRKGLSLGAYQRSHQFGFEIFKKQVTELFSEIEKSIKKVNGF
jgi:GT2 family glycosyltransferase